MMRVYLNEIIKLFTRDIYKYIDNVYYFGKQWLVTGGAVKQIFFVVSRVNVFLSIDLYMHLSLESVVVATCLLVLWMYQWLTPTKQRETEYRKGTLIVTLAYVCFDSLRRGLVSI